MAFCVECGSDIPEKAKFCPDCGASQDIQESHSTKDFGRTSKSNTPNLYGSVNLQDLPEGYEINNRYTVKEKLGQGGFASVYRVYDQNFEVDKALKVFTETFSSDKEAVEDLRRESKIMINLTHDRIVRIYDVHTDSSIKYIDMEYVDGMPLSEYKLQYEGKKVPEDKAIEIGKKIAEGLQYAHEKRVIHKDIKPQNILITEDGEVKITDFGISETVRTSMSRVQNNSSSGTLAYMAPEQVSGEEVGFEADVYSFGALMHELLSGKPPFHKGDLHYQIFNVEPKKIDGISKNINDVILKCLEKNYKDRFTSIKDVLERLKINIEEESIETDLNFSKNSVESKQSLTQEKAAEIHKRIQKNALTENERVDPQKQIHHNENSNRQQKNVKKKSPIKTFFAIMSIIFFSCIALIILIIVLVNFNFSKDMYTVKDMSVWGVVEDGTLTGVKFTIVNKSNSFTINSIEVKIDISDSSGNLINGFTQKTSYISVPPNSARDIDLRKNYNIVEGLPPNSDWSWDYKIAVKGTIFNY